MTGIGVAVCAALLSACADTPGQSERAPAARQFDLLVSQHNGYHYPPFLRYQPAAPEAQSYALRTLSELGRGAGTNVSAERVAPMRGEALSASPLWGRTWLIPLHRSGARSALGTDDVEAVEGLRTKGGWYVDPALGDDGDAARLGATWAALDVLRALGRQGSSATADWLRALAGTPRPLDESAALASALRLLDQPVPTTLTTFDAPRTSDWATLTPGRRTDRLSDTYDYVLIQEAGGRRPDIDRGTWEAVLRGGAPNLSLEHLYQLVHILKAAGSPASVFLPVVERLESDRLDDGTVRDPHAYLGNPDASLFVERLRALAGWPLGDRRLVAALDREERTGTAGEVTERLSRAALRRVATDGGVHEQARHLCVDPEVLPRAVTERNATLWQRTALDCADAGAEIATPEVPPWKLDTPARVVSAATVTIGMTDAGQRDAIPPWITSRALGEWAREPGRFLSVYDYTLVVRAYSLLGGAVDATMRGALGRGVTAYRGCAGLPDLYQVGGGDHACDLKTTWGVWALDRQLDGTMGWVPSRSGESGERAEVR
ncbi:hypothetical protein NFX46_38415 [Streptomyces phaeoluteigriseus]|uniref:Lipoprotein n=1 Tax=Streptomyces phaeoluteigriseus TaxID=114686 RepID=A0ABY4ZJD9_9ACTN|nr:hypothetical protein [Streptomyces phaeoluteigriseus]USQ89111.1 hypothetical protein NFX46_38415 [Streptomyces phaeoluteigriseus]